MAERPEHATGQGFPSFRARWPWRGADLQTLRNTTLRWLGRQPPDLSAYPAERREFPMEDGTGDRLVGTLNRPLRRAGRGLVVLIHGIGGSENGVYMRQTAASLLYHGYPVLRLNLRGAGPSRPLCRGQYHAGRTADLRAVVAQLSAAAEEGPALVGFSLGGNLMLKYLGEDGGTVPVRAAAAVSAPIDLASTSQRMLAPRNRLYHRAVLGWMKEEATAPAAALTEQERRAIERARTIYDFDDGFVARRHGYASADEYYARNSARRYLSSIRVPTLLVHAADDPWIPAEPYREFDWASNPFLHLLLTDTGGHLGFHDATGLLPWHDQCLLRFLSDHAGAA